MSLINSESKGIINVFCLYEYNIKDLRQKYNVQMIQCIKCTKVFQSLLHMVFLLYMPYNRDIGSGGTLGKIFATQAAQL